MPKKRLPPAGPLKGRTTGKLSPPPAVVKRANAESNKKFNAATNPPKKTPGPNPSKSRVVGKRMFAENFGKHVARTKMKMVTANKTLPGKGINSTDRLKGSSRITKFEDTASARKSPTMAESKQAFAKSKNLQGTVDTMHKEIQSKKAQIARGGKQGSGNSTTNLKGRKTNVSRIADFGITKSNNRHNVEKIQEGVKSKATGTTGKVSTKKQTSPARKTIGETARSRTNINASDALAKRGHKGSSTLGLTDPIRKAGSNVPKANTPRALTSTDTLKARPGTSTVPGSAGSLSTTPADVRANKIEGRDLTRAQTDLKATEARGKRNAITGRSTSAGQASSKVVEGIKREAGREAKASARAGSVTPGRQTGTSGPRGRHPTTSPRGGIGTERGAMGNAAQRSRRGIGRVGGGGGGLGPFINNDKLR